MFSAVKLTHVTPDAEDLIVFQARPHNPHSDRKDKLIEYLINHKHWSPFEMVSMGVEISTQRDIATQILRHRSFSFQEFSQRYADASVVGYTMPELRLQDTKNRQNSFDCMAPDEVYRSIKDHLNAGQQLYQDLIAHGYAKETARRILPVCQNTRIFMTGSVRSWIHYLEVRTGPETQKEHRLVAEQIKEVFSEQFPSVAAAVWPEVAEEMPVVEIEETFLQLFSRKVSEFFNV
jgi:thymidylate synthase (FAD)